MSQMRSDLNQTGAFKTCFWRFPYRASASCRWPTAVCRTTLFGMGLLNFCVSLQYVTYGFLLPFYVHARSLCALLYPFVVIPFVKLCIILCTFTQVKSHLFEKRQIERSRIFLTYFRPNLVKNVLRLEWKQVEILIGVCPKKRSVRHRSR